jgi:hypothetical protein
MTCAPFCQDCYPSPSPQPGLSPAGLRLFGDFALELADHRPTKVVSGLLAFQNPWFGVKNQATRNQNGGRAPCVLNRYLFQQCLRLQPFPPVHLSQVSRACSKPNRVVRLSVPLQVPRLPTTKMKMPSLVPLLARPSVAFRAVSRACHRARVSDLTAAHGRRRVQRKPSGHAVRVAFSYLPGGIA